MPDLSPTNLNDMILNIPVALTVELGRAQMEVREIMALAPGAVISLSRRASEPVDLFVNGHKIASGEIVVVDDQMGIKITEIAQ